MSDGMLIVCGNRDFGDQLCRIIGPAVPGAHSVAGSGAEARRRTGTSNFGAVVISGRLHDENAINLALELSMSGCGSIVLLADRRIALEAHEALDGTGVTILLMPITKAALVQSMQLVIKVKEEGGVLERAKLMLMQMKNLTEAQAHRYIQKVSMNRRLPREVTAQMIIKALQNGK